MTTVNDPNTDSGVPDFLSEEEFDGRVEKQPGTVEQPENSSEPQRQTAESATIGADRTTEKADEVNPVLDGDEEFDGEKNSPAPRKLRASTSRQAAPTAVANPQPVLTASVEAPQASDSHTEKDSIGRKRKMNPSAPKYGRTHMKEKDFLVMAFLRKFGFATSKQLSIVLGQAVATAHRRALGLREVGLVGSDKIFGATQLWYLTAKGYEVLDFHHLYDERISKRFHPGKGVPAKLEHTLAVIHVAAQLVGGVSEIRFIPGVELASGLDLLPALVPETYMNSEYSKATSDKKGKNKDDDALKSKPVEIAWANQKAIAQRIRDKKITRSEALQQYPFLWTVVNHPAARDSNKVKETHPADLVLDLSVLGEAWSGIKTIAIEVELSAKQAPELTKIIGGVYMNATSTYVPVFDYLVYISHKESIKTAVEAVAQNVMAGRNPLDFVCALDLKDATGEIFNGKAATL